MAKPVSVHEQYWAQTGKTARRGKLRSWARAFARRLRRKAQKKEDQE